MKSNKKAYLSLLMMLTLTLGTQLVVILKSSRMAALYGTSMEMDAYNFVNSIATFIFSFIGTGVSSVLIPNMVKENPASKAQNGFLTILYGLSLILLSIFFVFRRPFLTCFSQKNSEFVEIASSLMAIILFGQFVTCLNSVSTAFLQCRNCYNVPKLLGLFAAVIATVVIYAYDSFSIYKYAMLSFLLVLLEMAIQYIIAIRKGFRYSPCIPWKDPELQNMFRIFLPTVWGSGVYQITLMTDSVISAHLGTGSISVLSYANIISGMINTVIAGNVMLYIYPKIAAETNDTQKKRKLFQYMAFFAAIMCAIIVVFYAAGYDVLRILFERGKFNATATMDVLICVIIYLLGSPINIMRDLVYRYFYSRGNTKSTFLNGLSASLVNIVLSIVFAKTIGLYGVVLGTTITAVFSFVSILIRMKKQYTFDGNFPAFAKNSSKLIAATIVAIICCTIIKILPMSLPSLAISVIAAFTSFVVFVIPLLTGSDIFKVELI